MGHVDVAKLKWMTTGLLFQFVRGHHPNMTLQFQMYQIIIFGKPKRMLLLLNSHYLILSIMPPSNLHWNMHANIDDILIMLQNICISGILTKTEHGLLITADLMCSSNSQ